MRGILALLLAAGALACAGMPVLPSVGAEPGAAPRAAQLVPGDPEPEWRIAPTAQGAALELRF